MKLINRFVCVCSIITLLVSSTFLSEVQAVNVSADASVMIDANSGRILYQKNAFLKKPMASTTKIMTAILAIEKGDLGDIVTASKKATAIGGTSIDLYEGEEQKLEDLLYGLMLVSGNDAAIAIAEHIGGTTEEFAKMMSEKAHSIGAKNTQFKNPHGLDEDGHYTTAYDLALITRYALKNETFRRIISTKRKIIPDLRYEKWDRGLRNKNRLLYEYPGALGVKTGFTGKAGQCFVGAAQRNGLEVITVVLHDTMSKEAKWVDTKKLFDYAFGNYIQYKVFEKDEYIKTIPVKNGIEDILSATLDRDVYMMLNKKEKENLRIKVNTQEVLEAPIQKGDRIGGTEIYLEDEKMMEIPLYASRDIPKKTLGTEIEKILKDWLNLIKQGII